MADPILDALYSDDKEIASQIKEAKGQAVSAMDLAGEVWNSDKGMKLALGAGSLLGSGMLANRYMDIVQQESEAWSKAVQAERKALDALTDKKIVKAGSTTSRTLQGQPFEGKTVSQNLQQSTTVKGKGGKFASGSSSRFPQISPSAPIRMSDGTISYSGLSSASPKVAQANISANARERFLRYIVPQSPISAQQAQAPVNFGLRDQTPISIRGISGLNPNVPMTVSASDVLAGKPNMLTPAEQTKYAKRLDKVYTQIGKTVTERIPKGLQYAYEGASGLLNNKVTQGLMAGVNTAVAGYNAYNKYEDVNARVGKEEAIQAAGMEAMNIPVDYYTSYIPATANLVANYFKNPNTPRYNFKNPPYFQEDAVGLMNPYGRQPIGIGPQEQNAIDLYLNNPMP